MKNYDIISLDLFQTLVDVNQRIPEIWRGILNDDYSNDKAKIGGNAVLQCFSKRYQEATDISFLPMEEVYQRCARDAVAKTGLPYNPKVIAHHLMLEHGYAPFYPEVLDFLSYIKSRYRVIICSDSNHLMVDPLLDKLGIQDVFISEDLACYKGDLKGRFFQKVLTKLNIAPNRILHIGDSSADVIGARKANITACWLNRDHQEWKNYIKPDLMIDDLNQIKSILS